MTEPNSGKRIAVIGLGNMGSATGNSRPAMTLSKSAQSCSVKLLTGDGCLL